MLQELEEKRVEQEKEEYRKKVLFLTSCPEPFSKGVFTVQLGRKSVSVSVHKRWGSVCVHVQDDHRQADM